MDGEKGGMRPSIVITWIKALIAVTEGGEAAWGCEPETIKFCL